MFGFLGSFPLGFIWQDGFSDKLLVDPLSIEQQVGSELPLYLTWLKMAEMAKTWLNVDKKWLKWQKNAKMYGEPMLKNQRNIDRV